MYIYWVNVLGSQQFAYVPMRRMERTHKSLLQIVLYLCFQFYFARPRMVQENRKTTLSTYMCSENISNFKFMEL